MLASIVTFLLQNVVVALMLAVGLGTTPAALRATWQERRLVARALFVLELGVPLVALAVVAILPLGPEAKGVIALMAVCPGAPLILQRVRGRAVVLDIVALVSLLAPLTVPAWLVVLDRVLPFELGVDPAALFRITFLKMLLPLAAGVLIAAFLPRIAKALGRVALAFFFAALAVAIVVVLRLGAPVLAQASPWAYAAVLVVVLGSTALGHWAGSPRPEDQSALATVAVLGNPALALAVVAHSYPGYAAGAFVSAYLIARAVAMLPYAIVAKRRTRHGHGGAPTSRSSI